MESYGEILKTARENKDLTLQEVERDTSIPLPSIVALETEDKAAFPGEAYLVGFLKNYSEYLGCNTDELIKLYHAKELQESPVPMGLLEKPKKKYLIPLIVTITLLVLGGIGAYLYFGLFKVPQVREQKKLALTENKRIHTYEFKSTSQTLRLYVGDQIHVPEKEGTGYIVVTVADTLNFLNILTPAGNQIIELSEERELDIDGDETGDIIVYLSDISATNSDHGAEVRLMLKDESLVTQTIREPAVEESEEVETAGENIIVANQNTVTIIEDTRAYPFTVNATFRAGCVFRYKVDRQNYVEDYFKNHDIINVTANNGMRLWMSNSNVVKIQIQANSQIYDIAVGKAGEILVQDIRWIRADGKYRLVISDVD